MKTNKDSNRWQKLFYMLIALAKGNFSYRIKRSRYDDEIEAMSELGNMLSQDLQEIFSFHGFVNPRRTYIYLTKMDFYLDKELRIVNFSKEVPELLQLAPENLEYKHFREILDSQSLQVWEEITPQFQGKLFKRFSLSLNFKTGKGLSIHSNCYVSALYPENVDLRFSVSTFLPVLLDEASTKLDPALSFILEKEEYRSPKIFHQNSDLRQTHEVRDYILQNLGNDTMNMEHLTKKYFVTASKLKNDFKAVFGITPAQFLREERLKLAKELAQNTSLPLKNIAYTCGFSSYPHFSYAFKHAYKISPQQLRNSDI
jgi:AraC-like DNA-binding protein